MPFTGSHPAAILPFARTAMPLSALAVGSMVPDLPFYAPVPYSVRLCHELVGVLTVDLLSGLVLYAIWLAVLRPVIAVYLPSAIGRLPPPPRAKPWWIVAGLLVGALTHVVWDAFTHADGWGVQLVPVLDYHLGALPAYEWAQYASGAAGLAVIGWWTQRQRRARPAADDAGQSEASMPSPSRAVAGTVVALASAAGAAWGFRYGLDRPDPIRSAFFYAATWGIDFSIVGMLGIGLLNRYTARRLP
jgi:hypothetical protein